MSRDSTQPLSTQQGQAKALASTLARKMFPRGLSQPENGFRFSVDALVLAEFALKGAAQKTRAVLDMGAGCGVIGFAMALQQEALSVTALDADPSMLVHIRENSTRLGLKDRFSLLQCDVCHARQHLAPESMDVVVCNPPYRKLGTGRTSPVAERNNALFESSGILEDFLEAARFVLKNKAQACFVYPTERLPEFLATAQQLKLEPKDLLMIHGKADSPAKLFLARLRKNGSPGLAVPAPLILYNSNGSLTAEAAAFCPNLACNARR